MQMSKALLPYRAYCDWSKIFVAVQFQTLLLNVSDLDYFKRAVFTSPSNSNMGRSYRAGNVRVQVMLTFHQNLKS